MTNYLRFSIFLLLAFFALALFFNSKLLDRPFATETALHEVDCPFTLSSFVSRNIHTTECYEVSVPENHALTTGPDIKFPLIVFKAKNNSGLPPVLHLGAGGPGAPMYLDESHVLEYLLETHDAFSINLGRDFYIIDPRGSGLSTPLLSCNLFIKNLPSRLEQNLNQRTEWEISDRDYFACIDEFKKQGVDFSQYNSESISQDVEFLRKQLGVRRWSLIGVSYGAVYAQIIAKTFPSSVEAMILDSAAFQNLKIDNRFIERTLAPYQALYSYCDIDPDCVQALENLQSRLWKIVEKLNQDPAVLTLPYPSSPNSTNSSDSYQNPLTVVLNGHRFVSTLIEGVYGENIFYDLPAVIEQVEQNQFDLIQQYLQTYIEFLFETSYGDLSATAHFCFEDKPFIDVQALLPLLDEIEEPYIRETARMGLLWPDPCSQMGIGSANAELVAALKTDIPTLFLHGKFDSITPLEDVYALKENFKNSQIVSFDLSHGIIGADDKAEEIVKTFMQSLPISE